MIETTRGLASIKIIHWAWRTHASEFKAIQLIFYHLQSFKSFRLYVHIKFFTFLQILLFIKIPRKYNFLPSHTDPANINIKRTMGKRLLT